MRNPPFNKFPELVSEDIHLREIRKDDIPSLIEISFYNAIPALTLNEAILMHEQITADYRNGTSVHWGIFDINTRKVLGTIGFYRGFDQSIGEIGCVLKPDFYGKGIMTKAMKLVIDFGFDFIGLTRIVAITDKQNLKAVNLLERLNYNLKKELNKNEVEYQFAH